MVMRPTTLFSPIQSLLHDREEEQRRPPRQRTEERESPLGGVLGDILAGAGEAATEAYDRTREHVTDFTQDTYRRTADMLSRAYGGAREGIRDTVDTVTEALPSPDVGLGETSTPSMAYTGVRDPRDISPTMEVDAVTQADPVPDRDLVTTRVADWLSDAWGGFTDRVTTRAEDVSPSSIPYTGVRDPRDPEATRVVDEEVTEGVRDWWDRYHGFGVPAFTKGLLDELTMDTIDEDTWLLGDYYAGLPDAEERIWSEAPVYWTGRVLGAIPTLAMGRAGISAVQRAAAPARTGLATETLRRVPRAATAPRLYPAGQAAAQREAARLAPRVGESALPRIAQRGGEGAARLGTISLGRQAVREAVGPEAGEPGTLDRLGRAAGTGMATGALLGAVSQTIPEARFKLYKFGEAMRTPRKVFESGRQAERAGFREDPQNPGIFVGPGGTRYTMTVEHRGTERLLPEVLRQFGRYPRPGPRDLPRALFTQRPYATVPKRIGVLETGERTQVPRLTGRVGEAPVRPDAPTPRPDAPAPRLTAPERTIPHYQKRAMSVRSEDPGRILKRAKNKAARGMELTKEERNVFQDHYRDVMGQQFDGFSVNIISEDARRKLADLTEREKSRLGIRLTEEAKQELEPVRETMERAGTLTPRRPVSTEQSYPADFRGWLEAGMPVDEEPIAPSLEAEIRVKSQYKPFREEVQELQRAREAETQLPSEPAVEATAPAPREYEFLPEERVELSQRIERGEGLVPGEETDLVQGYEDLTGGRYTRADIEAMPEENQLKLARLHDKDLERDLLDISFEDDAHEYLQQVALEEGLYPDTPPPEPKTPSQESFINKLEKSMKDRGVSEPEQEVILEHAKRMMQGAEEAGINLDLSIRLTDNISEELTDELLAAHGLEPGTDAYVAGRAVVESDGKLFKAVLDILTNRQEPMAQEALHELAEVWTAAWEIGNPEDYQAAVGFLVDKGLTEERAREHLSEIITDYALSGAGSDSLSENLLDRLIRSFKEWVMRVMRRLQEFKKRVWPNLPENIRQQAQDFSAGRWEKVFAQTAGRNINQQVRHHIRDKGLAKPFYSRLRNYIVQLPQDKFGKQEILSKLKKATGFKKDELEWSGLIPYIEGYPGKSIPKEDLLNNLQEIELQETRLGYSAEMDLVENRYLELLHNKYGPAAKEFNQMLENYDILNLPLFRQAIPPEQLPQTAVGLSRIEQITQNFSTQLDRLNRHRETIKDPESEAHQFLESVEEGLSTEYKKKLDKVIRELSRLETLETEAYLASTELGDPEYQGTYWHPWGEGLPGTYEERLFQWQPPPIKEEVLKGAFEEIDKIGERRVMTEEGEYLLELDVTPEGVERTGDYVIELGYGHSAESALKSYVASAQRFRRHLENVRGLEEVEDLTIEQLQDNLSTMYIPIKGEREYYPLEPVQESPGLTVIYDRTGLIPLERKSRKIVGAGRYPQEALSSLIKMVDTAEKLEQYIPGVIPGVADFPWEGEHFERYENVMASTRGDVVKDLEGNKLKRTAEYQSDWHDQAREEGFYRMEKIPDDWSVQLEEVDMTKTVKEAPARPVDLEKVLTPRTGYESIEQAFSKSMHNLFGETVHVSYADDGRTPLFSTPSDPTPVREPEKALKNFINKNKASIKEKLEHLLPEDPDPQSFYKATLWSGVHLPERGAEDWKKNLWVLRDSKGNVVKGSVMGDETPKDEALRRFTEAVRSENVPPPAPFSDSKHWAEHLIKQEIRDAIFRGHKGVVFSDGEVQTDRGNLAHYGVERIDWERKLDTAPDFVEASDRSITRFKSTNPTDWSEGYTYEITLHMVDGRAQTIIPSEKDLSFVLGDKNIAEEIINTNSPSGSVRVDPQMRVGRKGKYETYGYLDRETGEYKPGIFHKFLPKYLKQWGAKIEALQYQGGDGTIRTDPGIMFTKEMVDDVLYKGQPLSIRDHKRDAILETYQSIDWEGKGKRVPDPERRETEVETAKKIRKEAERKKKATEEAKKPKKTPEEKRADKAKRARERRKKEGEVPTQERPAVRKTEAEQVHEMRKAEEKRAEGKRVPPEHEQTKKKPTTTTKKLKQRVKAHGFKDIDHARLAFEAMELGKEEWVRRFPEMHKGFLKTYVKDASPGKMYDELVKYVKHLNIPEYNKLKEQIKGLVNQRRGFSPEQRAMIRDWQKEIRDILKRKDLRKEYREEIESLLSEIDWGAFKRKKSTIQRLQNTREWLKRNPDSYLPERVIEELKTLDKVPLGEMTFEQIKNLVDTIKNLAKLSDTKNYLTFKRARRALDEGIEEIREDFRKTHPVIKEFDKEMKEIDTMVQNKEPGRLKQIYTSESLQPEFITQLLQGKEEGFLKKVLYDDVDKGISERYRIQFEHQDKFREAVKKALGKGWEDELQSWSKSMNKKIKNVKQEKIKLDEKRSIKLTPDERMAIYLHYKSPHNREELVEGGFRVPLAEGVHHKLSAEDLKKVVDSMPQKEVDVAEAISRGFRELGVSINEVSNRLEGAPMQWEENYFPLLRSTVRSKRDPIPEFRPRNFSQRLLDQMGFLRPRREKHQPVLLRGAIEVFHMYLQDASSYVGLAEPVRNAKKVLRDEGLVEDLTKAGKKHYHKALEEYINDIEGYFHSQSVLDELTLKWLNPIHTSILGLNPGIMLKQTTSYLAAATEMDIKHLLKPVFTSIKQAKKEMSQWEPQMRFRDEGKINRETGEIGEVGTLLQWATGKSFLNKKFTEGIRWFDSMVVGRVWNAVKSEIKEKHPELKVGSKEFMQKVAERHREVVNRTQPTYVGHTRSTIGRSRSPFVRGITPFHTQRNKNYNIIARELWRYNNSNKTASDKARFYKMLAAMFFATPVYLMAIDELRDLAFRRDPDQSTAARTVRAIGNAVSVAYVAGPLYDSIASKVQRGTWAGYEMASPFYSVIWEFTDAVSDSITAVDHAVKQERYDTGTKEGEKRWKTDAMRAVDNWAAFISRMWGIPYHNVRSITEGIAKELHPDAEFKIDTITRNPQPSYYYDAFWDNLKQGREGRAKENLRILHKEFGITHRGIERSYLNRRDDFDPDHYREALNLYGEMVRGLR